MKQISANIPVRFDGPLDAPQTPPAEPVPIRVFSMDTRERRDFAAEIKFLVSRALAEQIRSWARGRLLPDPHAGGANGDAYRITSLYFDTERFDVFHRRGSYGRAKYRIRRYGDSDVAFLERKMRTRTMLAKRRSVVPLDDLERLASTEPQRGWPGFWFHRRMLLRGLGPVCQIQYDRTARVLATANGVARLTMDDNLRAVPAAGLWFAEQAGAALLEDQIILELKFRREAPALFRYLIEEFALDSRPFSKYRLAAASLGLVSDLDEYAPQRAMPSYA